MPAYDISVTNSLIVDILHALFLGTLHEWCKVTLWELITSEVFAACSTIQETVHMTVLSIQAELPAFYKRKSADHLTPIGCFSAKTIGANSERVLRTKGAETWGFALYLVEKLDQVGHRCSEKIGMLHVAGRALCNMVHLWKRCARQLTASELQQSMDLYKTYLSSTATLDELELPKRHSIIHLIRGIRWYGNPFSYACWTDGALNKELKKMCRTVSSATFDFTVLLSARASSFRFVNKRKR